MFSVSQAARIFEVARKEGPDEWCDWKSILGLSGKKVSLGYSVYTLSIVEIYTAH